MTQSKLARKPKEASAGKGNALIRLEDFSSFDNDAIAKLKILGLSDKAIRELYRQTYQELGWLRQLRSAPNTKARKRKLEATRKSIKDALLRFQLLDEITLRTSYDLWLDLHSFKVKAAESLGLLDAALDFDGKAGGEFNDLDQLVCRVARVMHDSGLKDEIKPNGNLFLRILEIVFIAINEKAGSIRAAIDKAWTIKPNAQRFERPYYLQSIQELINPDVYLFDRYTSDLPEDSDSETAHSD